MAAPVTPDNARTDQLASSAAASRVTAPMRHEVTPGPAPEPSLEVVHDGHARCPGHYMLKFSRY
jgi:hypothetical protein